MTGEPGAARRAMLQMIVLIVAVDTAAVVLYRFTSLGHTSRDSRLVFAVIWTLLSLAIVLTGLRRIRVARGR